MFKQTDTVKCTRCRNKHLISERIDNPAKDGTWDSTCPRCGGKEFIVQKAEIEGGKS